MPAEAAALLPAFARAARAWRRARSIRCDCESSVIPETQAASRSVDSHRFADKAAIFCKKLPQPVEPACAEHVHGADGSTHGRGDLLNCAAFQVVEPNDHRIIVRQPR